MGISKYPRFGQRIAPATLRDILSVETPSGILSDVTGKFAQLAGLDESAWHSASQKDCRLLGSFVVREVRIPAKADTDSDNCRTPIPIELGQWSERSDGLGLAIKNCPK